MDFAPFFISVLVLASTAHAADCNFIQKKINELPPTGGKVLIPEGSYTCSTALYIDHPHVTLSGTGVVTLKLADKANSPLIVMGSLLTPPLPTEDIEVSNIKLDGNKDNQQMECWGGPCDGAGTTPIRNNGISVRKVINGRIKNVYVNGARSGGVVTELGTLGLQIDNLTSENNFFDGLAGCDTHQSTYKNLNLSHNHAAGISTDIDFSDNTIINAKLIHNGDVGIFMRYSNNNKYEDFDIENSGNHGVFLAESEGSITCPTNNEFFNLKVLNSKGAGFKLNDDCKGNRITGQSEISGSTDCVSSVAGASVDVQSANLCR